MAADAPVIVTFDHRVAFSSLRGRFSVQPAIPGCNLETAFGAGPAAACAVRPLEGSNGFRLDHGGAIFAPDREYAFTLGAGITDKAGIANSLDHNWAISTATAPTVRVAEPEDGAQSVALDAVLSMSFSRSMRESTTVASITLQPPVEGTTVSRNTRDHSRFVIQPGRLFDPGSAYQLLVSQAATDEHGQRLAGDFSSRFTVGGLRSGGHAVILAGRPGEAASAVLLSTRAPTQPGDPLPTVSLLLAPRCPAPSCGAVAHGAPLDSFEVAALSPEGGRLAVVVADSGSGREPLLLRVLDLVHARVVAEIPGGADPTWSPDGRSLEYTEAGEFRFLAISGARPSLPAGPQPAGLPVWTPDGEALVLSTVGTDGTPGLELASPGLGARYPVPGLSGAAADPALSPSGRLLALRRPASKGAGAAAEIIELASGRVAQRLAGDLRPLAFVDEATLLAVQHPGSAAARLVRLGVGSGEVTPVELGPAARPETLSVSADRRTVGFIAAAGPGPEEAFVLMPQGADRRRISSVSERGLTASALSLN